MRADLATIVSAFGVGTALGSIVTLLTKHHLLRRSEQRRRQRETDRATYQDRMTCLIRANLSTLIRSNRCRDGEREDMAELIQELSDGAHQVRFLDPKVQIAWAALARKTARYGQLRLAGAITEPNIADYVSAWEAWMQAARESFGPLPESDPPALRRPREAEALTREAA